MNKQEAINLLPTNAEVEKDPKAAAEAWAKVPDETKSELIKDGSVSVDHNLLAGQTVVYLSDEAETSKVVAKGKAEESKKAADEVESKKENTGSGNKPKK
jgi:hypothetical protein